MEGASLAVAGPSGSDAFAWQWSHSEPLAAILLLIIKLYKSKKLTLLLCKMPHSRYFSCLRQPIPAVINDPLTPYLGHSPFSSLSGSLSFFTHLCGLVYLPCTFLRCSAHCCAGRDSFSVSVRRTTRANAVIYV